MSSKSVSMIKKHRLIREELNNFPVFGHRSLSSSTVTIGPKIEQQSGKDQVKRKWALQKGKSLEIESHKMFQGSVNNFKKSAENPKPKSSGLIKKKRNKTIKQQSFSRASLISSENLPSMPSTSALNCEAELSRLTQQNKKYKEVIQKQVRHIRSLQLLISGL